MSREIKFRVWSEDQKTYDYKFPYNSIGDFYVNSRGKVFSDFGNTVVPEVRQEAFVVEQYTGLKDKNGKEIYEGDIVKIDDLDDITYVGEPVKIVFEDGAFIMRCVEHNSIITDEYGMAWVIGFMVKGILEVIGNTHENPELLEGE